ncbi:terminase small subunit [Candidatus Woesearchaeota archaeon]|nr:terminase small subunit [Candidatus Woesearchaeota archaeon]
MASKAGNSHGLTDLELNFCWHYAKTLHGGNAVREAGYNVSSDATASGQASRLLKKAKIRAYLGEVLNLNPPAILHQLVQIVNARITDVMSFDSDGAQLIPSDQLSDRGKAALKSVKTKTKTRTIRIEGDTVETETTTEIEVVMYDRLVALEKLMRKLQLYPKQGSILELLEALANHGVLVPEQAEVISGGIAVIEERLRSLPVGSFTAGHN